jgi:hypothetical protein
MPSYRFSIHGNGRHSRENAGWMTLADDDEAVAFAKAVIRDLLHGNAMRYTRSIMDVTQGERAVVGIPFAVFSG